jgi:predicted dehydrogenase
MKTLKAAVIGTGFIGPAHAEALRRVPGVELVAIASNEPERAREVAERYGVERVYDTWEAVLRDPDVDVVHNCTPNNLHFRINKAALSARKHVLSEKPLTMTSRESAELVALARKLGLANGVNFNYRFYPLIQHARAMVRKGELGEIFLIHGHYLQDWLHAPTDYNWRIDPAVSGPSRAVADIGSHWCDLVQFITGRRITRVCANLATVHKTRSRPAGSVETFQGKLKKAEGAKTVRIRTEDLGTVMLEFEGGTQGMFAVSQVSAGRKNREWFEIDGSLRSIAWDQEEPNQLWVGRRDGPNETIIKDPSLIHEEARRYAHYPGGHPEGYTVGPKNLFWNFYEFIRAGRDPRRESPDFPTFADGHRAICVVEAVVQSNKERGWVAVTIPK